MVCAGEFTNVHSTLFASPSPVHKRQAFNGSNNLPSGQRWPAPTFGSGGFNPIKRLAHLQVPPSCSTTDGLKWLAHPSQLLCPWV